MSEFAKICNGMETIHQQTAQWLVCLDFLFFFFRFEPPAEDEAAETGVSGAALFALTGVEAEGASSSSGGGTAASSTTCCKCGRTPISDGGGGGHALDRDSSHDSSTCTDKKSNRDSKARWSE